MVLTVAVVQIKTLLGSCAASEREKYEKLSDEWLLGCAKHGVAAVGEEVRVLHSTADTAGPTHSTADTAAPYRQHC